MQTLDSFRRLVLTGAWKDPDARLLLVVHRPRGTPSQRRFRTASGDEDGISVPPLTLVIASTETRAVPIVKRENSPYEGFIFVGRAVTADIVLDDASISKSHAAFQRAGEEWFLKDVRSRNGTFIDGQRLDGAEPVPVRNGSQLTFGSLAAYFVELPYLRQARFE